MKAWKAEVIAIGDEIVSGQRLDTNSQWLSHHLGELGLEVAFHSSVGDSLEDGIAVCRSAIQRADVVISTGGIGPTRDDLTRQVIAAVADVELELHEEVVEHVRAIFAKSNREMPENNVLQAYFPAGSIIIPNSEGTAPGIDINVAIGNQTSRLFALPGVPYEMKEMWSEYVQPAIQIMTGRTHVIRHHVVHCFGAGESQIETMLDGMTDRSRQPRVGITASQATISLRITATGNDEFHCLEQISPTVAAIRSRLGDLVFGENGVELHQVVKEILLDRNLSVAIVDCGFGGLAAHSLFDHDDNHRIHRGSMAINWQNVNRWLGESTEVDLISAAARKIRREFDSDIGVSIGQPNQSRPESTPMYEVAIADQSAVRSYALNYAGHSGLRQSRTTKQILNQIRLHLLG